MKRLACLVAVVLWLVMGSAMAEEAYQLEDTQMGRIYSCVDFQGTMPENVEAIFAPLMRPGDDVLCGSSCKVISVRTATTAYQSILMAVQREGKVLLMGAYQREGDWEVCLETDDFLSGPFEITCLPQESEEGVGLEPGLGVICGDEIWHILVTNGGRLQLTALECKLPDGARRVMIAAFGTLICYAFREDGTREELGDRHCGVPMRLSAWKMEDFPRDVEQMHRYADAHQPDLQEDEAYIFGVNLRTEPTTQSRSLGKYSARVKLRGEPQGAWYPVRVGDTDGWVNGTYLRDGSRYDIRLYAMGVMTLPFARADEEVGLRKSPEGETFARLLPGAKMYVLAENEGWLHVLVPKEGEIQATVDWDGIYGYVRTDEVVQGNTLAELAWKTNNSGV